MQVSTQLSKNSEKYLKILAWLIILVGVVVRLAVFIQNRNLFIDEANLARNLYERGFIALSTPLAYEQYAPPVFLWVVKFFALLFGYGEMTLRLYPFLSGIATLVIMLFIMKELTSYKSLWYPLFLLVSAAILVRYSSELKQYMSDVFFVVSLVLLTLKIDIQKRSATQFVLIWLVVGSIAIWGSMPSVFVLAGVGAYYIWSCIQSKDYKRLVPVVIVGVLWMLQFLFYYLTILKPQANTSYLQNFHRDYFLFAMPDSKEQWLHNWYVCKGILEEAGGATAIAWIFNLLMFIVGAVIAIRKQTAVALLVLIPLLATIIAASFGQFSLIPRVALFMIPLILIMIGYGFEKVLSLKVKPLQVVLVIIAFICAKNHNSIRMIYEPFRNEQITDGLQFLQKYHIVGQQVYVHQGARPAMVYYTEIHPDKQKWGQFKDAHMLWWDVKYDTVSQSNPGRVGFIYTSMSAEERTDCSHRVESHRKLVDKLEGDQYGTKCAAYVYEKQ